jgi:hypothetical protein
MLGLNVLTLRVEVFLSHTIWAICPCAASLAYGFAQTSAEASRGAISGVEATYKYLRKTFYKSPF